MISTRVAIATSTGNSVDMHFGQCDTFYIYKLNGEDRANQSTDTTEASKPDVEQSLIDSETPFKFIETRQVEKCCNGGSHTANKFEKIADVLSDCEIILCEQIGPHASREMDARGFAIFEVEASVEAALKALASKLYMIIGH
jgi:predicted Fe-Mo cluster-binding NifX family protein